MDDETKDELNEDIVEPKKQKTILTKVDPNQIQLINQLHEKDKTANLIVIDVDIYQIQQKEERELLSLRHRFELEQKELEFKMNLEAQEYKKEWFQIISKAILTFSVFGSGVYFVSAGDIITGNFLLGGALYTLCKKYVIKFGKKIIGG
ncbi:hypothetical protein GMMP1_140103 [Candidatus Magnetomoraceae bacterium gMMP-1]